MCCSLSGGTEAMDIHKSFFKAKAVYPHEYHGFWKKCVRNNRTWSTKSFISNMQEDLSTGCEIAPDETRENVCWLQCSNYHQFWVHQFIFSVHALNTWWFSYVLLRMACFFCAKLYTEFSVNIKEIFLSIILNKYSM
jgi:hypothetical protein